MASLFVTLRLTGHVSNGEAREFVARLTDLAEAADLAGIEVKQSVDVRLDPEFIPIDSEPGPAVDVPVAESEPVAVPEDAQPEPEV